MAIIKHHTDKTKQEPYPGALVKGREHTCYGMLYHNGTHWRVLYLGSTDRDFFNISRWEILPGGFTITLEQEGKF